MRPPPRVALLATAFAAAALAAPAEQHLSWSGSPGSSIDITWSDATSTAESVQYGATASYGSTAAEASSPLTLPGSANFSHHVKLTGLSAGTLYHYAPPGAADHAFTTAGTATSFSFVAFGDQGITATASSTAGGGCSLAQVGGGPGVAGVPEATAQQAAAVNPDLALFLGDCTYSGQNGVSVPAAWDGWFAANTVLTADRPWFPAVGNHDEPGGQGPGTSGDATNFFGRFYAPPPFAPQAGWYSFDLGGVHFVVLSGDFYGSGSQSAWLSQDLSSAAAKNANWRVLLVHQPAWSSSCFQGDPYEDGVRALLASVTGNASNAHVDLVLQGHRHVYERTYMLSGAGPTVDTQNYDAATRTYTMATTAGTGTVYVTHGASGHSMHGWSVNPAPSWSANRAQVYHWARYAVTPTAITVDVHDTQANNLVETFTLKRPSLGPCGPSNCSGCCDSAGVCQAGMTTQACGKNGGSCAACGAGQSCSGGACAVVACGPSNCNGCCDAAGACQTGTAAQACGKGGMACAACTGTQVCSAGACGSAPPCGPSNCNGCCDASGTCQTGMATAQCGQGGVACQNCGTATCSATGACGDHAPCTAANCSGCCMGTMCVQLVNENAQVCGAGAAACASCSAGQACQTGICKAPCSAATCSGCCDASGACQAGTTASACGGGGAACASCTGGDACASGACKPVSTSSCGPCAGCCQGSTCMQGDSDAACGGGGQACNACLSPLTCNAGVCGAAAQAPDAGAAKMTAAGCCRGAQVPGAPFALALLMLLGIRSRRTS